eukprot:853563-Prymnesium_polylepis.1
MVSRPPGPEDGFSALRQHCDTTDVGGKVNRNPHRRSCSKRVLHLHVSRTAAMGLRTMLAN